MYLCKRNKTEYYEITAFLSFDVYFGALRLWK